MNPVTNSTPTDNLWIGEFRRMNLHDKCSLYPTLSLEQQTLLKQTLVTGPILTVGRLKESMRYNHDPNSYGNISLPFHLVDYLKVRTVTDVIVFLQLYDVPALSNLDKTGIKMSDVAKYFEYGVYRDFMDNPISRPISAINAWLFGFAWDQLLPQIGHLREYENPRIRMTVDEWKILMPCYPWESILGGKHATYHDVQNFAERIDLFPLRGSGRLGPFNGSTRKAHDAMVDSIFEEISRRGVMFESILPVYHFNHLRFVPKEYGYMQIDKRHDDKRNLENSDLTDYLMGCESQYVPYPRFHRSLWWSYPKALKSIIFTVMCLMGHRRKSFSLGRDVTMNILMNYVVFNFYVDAEEKLQEWTTRAEKYMSIEWTTLDNIALDCGLASFHRGKESVSNANRKQLGYRLAAFVLGYADLDLEEARFVSYVGMAAIDWTSIHNMWPELRGDNRDYSVESSHKFRNSLDAMKYLLRDCYGSKICISLIRHGLIKFTKNGRILDTREAQKLSHTRRQENFQILGRLIDSSVVKDESDGSNKRTKVSTTDK